jgi:hypothetical protein
MTGQGWHERVCVAARHFCEAGLEWNLLGGDVPGHGSAGALLIWRMNMTRFHTPAFEPKPRHLSTDFGGSADIAGTRQGLIQLETSPKVMIVIRIHAAVVVCIKRKERPDGDFRIERRFSWCRLPSERFADEQGLRTLARLDLRA